MSSCARLEADVSQVGLARTIYVRCIYGFCGREFTKYTVIYGVDIRFWPTLLTSDKPSKGTINLYAGSQCGNERRRGGRHFRAPECVVSYLGTTKLAMCSSLARTHSL
jgi:hypothetical protein